MNIMSAWQSLRIPFLAATLGGICLVLGKSVFDPSIGKPTSYQFPAQVPLSGWQAEAAAPHASRQRGHYRYRQGGEVLEVEMRYLTDTNGDFRAFLQDHTARKVPANQVSIRQQQTGFYGLSRHQGRAYLTACINPLGGSTLTRQQFLHNRQTHDLQPRRLWAWLLAQTDLRDRRCLWAHLSLPVNSAAPQATEQKLEAAWLDWSQFWQSHFPKL